MYDSEHRKQKNRFRVEIQSTEINGGKGIDYHNHRRNAKLTQRSFKSVDSDELFIEKNYTCIQNRGAKSERNTAQIRSALGKYSRNKNGSDDRPGDASITNIGAI